MRQTAETVAPQRELVNACIRTIAALQEILKREDDHILQHSLTNLMAELQWCTGVYMPGGLVKKEGT